MTRQQGIAKRLREHLGGDGTLNDGETDALYREWFRIPEGEETDLETVERWAFETASRQERPMGFRYAPLYRPPSTFTLPEGFVLVERPALGCGFERRADLPVSREPFGVVEYRRPLSDDEVRRFQVKEV